MKKKIAVCCFVLLTLFVVGGCESDAQTGALIGSLAGAGIGQAIGGNTESTLIGAGVGAAGGHIVGSESDRRKERAKTDAEIRALKEQQNIVEVWITNNDGFSKTLVRLRKDGYGGYIGEKNERYPSMPTEEQLKKVGYGF